MISFSSIFSKKWSLKYLTPWPTAFPQPSTQLPSLKQLLSITFTHQTVPIELLPAATAVNESFAKKSMMPLSLSWSSAALLGCKWILYSCLTFKLYYENCSLEPNRSLHLSQIQNILDPWKQFFPGENNVAWKVDKPWTVATSISTPNNLSSSSKPVSINWMWYHTFKVFWNFLSRNYTISLEHWKKNTSCYLLTNSNLSKANHVVDLK